MMSEGEEMPKQMFRIYLDEAHNERTTLDNYQAFKTQLGEYGKVFVSGSSYRPLTASFDRFDLSSRLA